MLSHKDAAVKFDMIKKPTFFTVPYAYYTLVIYSCIFIRESNCWRSSRAECLVISVNFDNWYWILSAPVTCYITGTRYDRTRLKTYTYFIIFFMYILGKVIFLNISWECLWAGRSISHRTVASRFVFVTNLYSVTSTAARRGVSIGCRLTITVWSRFNTLTGLLTKSSVFTHTSRNLFWQHSHAADLWRFAIVLYRLWTLRSVTDALIILLMHV